jgi:hypothetical protein
MNQGAAILWMHSLPKVLTDFPRHLAGYRCLWVKKEKEKEKEKRKKKKRKRKEEDSENPCSSMLTSTDRYALTSLMSHLPCSLRACTNEPEFSLR